MHSLHTHIFVVFSGPVWRALDTNACVNTNNGVFITYAKNEIVCKGDALRKNNNNKQTRRVPHTTPRGVVYFFPHFCAHSPAPRSPAHDSLSGTKNHFSIHRCPSKAPDKDAPARSANGSKTVLNVFYFLLSTRIRVAFTPDTRAFAVPWAATFRVTEPRRFTVVSVYYK